MFSAWSPDFRHLRDDILIVRSHHLRSVRPVSLVSVVLSGVMRSGDHHAALAPQFPDGEAEFGGRTERVEQEYLEPVRGENIGYPLGKLAAPVAAVVPHGHPDLLSGKRCGKIVRQPLRGHPHGVYVHAVGAHAHDAAQPPRAKLKVSVKTFGKFFRIIVNQILNPIPGRFVEIFAKPLLRTAEKLFVYLSVHNRYWFYL